MKAHWDSLAAADFFTTEIWTLRGLVTFYVPFIMELSTRKVYIARITRNPNESFMVQVAKNLTDDFNGLLRGKRSTIFDRDSSPEGAAISVHFLTKNLGLNGSYR